MGEVQSRRHKLAHEIRVGDTVTVYRWRVEAVTEREGTVYATGRNPAGDQFALNRRATREVLVWDE